MRRFDEVFQDSVAAICSEFALVAFLSLVSLRCDLLIWFLHQLIKVISLVRKPASLKSSDLLPATNDESIFFLSCGSVKISSIQSSHALRYLCGHPWNERFLVSVIIRTRAASAACSCSGVLGMIFCCCANGSRAEYLLNERICHLATVAGLLIAFSAFFLVFCCCFTLVANETTVLFY